MLRGRAHIEWMSEWREETNSERIPITIYILYLNRQIILFSSASIKRNESHKIICSSSPPTRPPFSSCALNPPSRPQPSQNSRNVVVCVRTQTDGVQTGMEAPTYRSIKYCQSFNLKAPRRAQFKTSLRSAIQQIRKRLLLSRRHILSARIDLA